MAKMSRTQLKSIVKECLVEILSEGLTSSASDLTERKKQSKRMKQEKQRLKEHRAKFDVRVDSAVDNISQDPIMKDILADTARTTLQEQLAGETPMSGQSQATPGIAAGSTGAGINLDNIIGESKQNWGKLAFEEK